MSRRRVGLRGRWLEIVWSHPAIGDACRVLLLCLAETMTDAGRVSVPRDRIAERLQISERRVTDRITEATRAGLLVKAGGGYRGVTAVYEALIPKVDVLQPPLTPKGGGFPSTKNVHLSIPPGEKKVDVLQPPNAGAHAGASVTESRERADTAPDSRAPQSPNNRSDERTTSALAFVAAPSNQPSTQRTLRVITGEAS